MSAGRVRWVCEVVVKSARAGHLVGARYRLVRELGAGGFGRVWRARDETLGVDVAIKELRLVPGMSQAEQAERLARATREARNAARLRWHENIVAIHDIVAEDGLPWIVLDLIDGVSLDEWVRTRGPLSVERTTAVASALVAAVSAAHQKGVIHRDIKPANVLLAAGGKVLLTDFGTAVHDTDTTVTATGMVVGSPEYTAPERLRGKDGLPASDLFSLGATLFEAVEGVSPFRRGNPTATLSAVLLDEVPMPRRAGPLTELITRLLDKDPATRPSIDGVREALAAVAAGSTTRMPTTTGPIRSRTRIIGTGQHTGTDADGDAVVLRWPVAVAVLLGMFALLGLVSYASQDYQDLVYQLPVGFLWGVAIDAALVGVLGAGTARLVPVSAGENVRLGVGVAGFVVAGGSTALALLDIGRHLVDVGASLMVPLSLATLAVLGTVGGVLVAWRRRRRPAPEPAELGW